MDCNKEEATRAKEMAEKKMQSKDFVGARKIVLRAQQLYPDLENITQMLTVCQVHCSAEYKGLGSEMDWYGILQVEKTADETSIKKQYRKLALLLHPDKNKFAGAEAAFKLIGEANRVLTDQTKRSAYDMKCRASMRTVVPRQPQMHTNWNSSIKKQPGARNNFVNTSTPQFYPHKQQQQTQPGFSNGQQTFWTSCPFCNIKYQYYRDYVNRALRCNNCKQPFVAYDLGAQGMPPETNRSRSAFPQQKEVPNVVDPKVGQQSTVGDTSAKRRFRGNVGTGATALGPFPKTGSTSDVGGGSKCKVKDEDADMEHRKEGENRPKCTTENPDEGKASGNTSRKRRRKSEVESSDSDTGSSTDSKNREVREEDGATPAGQSTGFTGERRRSTRLKQHVTYDEDSNDDDDFVSPPKRSKRSKSSNATEEKSNEASLKREASRACKPSSSTFIYEECKKEEKQEGRAAPLEEILPSGKDEAGKFTTNEAEMASMDENKGRSEGIDKLKFNLGSKSKSKSDPELVGYPDPDFNDFNKDRKEECFAADQIWAVYDNLDSMPRFYVWIRKVFSPGFRLRITWLEPDPDDEAGLDWLSEDLPVACGKFLLGNSEITKELLMFSHLVHWEKGTGRGSYKIYPRKGETWALFKNWDIRWASDPDNHREYEFEFVEVLSDYAEEGVLGIRVAYLVKVKGFVSLFRQIAKNGTHSFLIPPNELLRFSHRVPSFVMTDMDRKNVPKGSLELDPASLPVNLKEFANPEEVTVNAVGDDSKHGVSLKSQAEEVKPVTRGKRPNTPKKRMDSDDKNTQDGGISKSRNSSARELNGNPKKKLSETNVSQCVTSEKTSKHFLSKQQDNEIPETVFHSFDANRSQEKFQAGQIWALYCDKDALPKYYVRINKIESPPDFKLHVTWLEACPAPKDIQWFDKDMPVGCGTFKLASDARAVYTSVTSFSHQLSIESSGRNKYEIYPRKGEVWALYKHFNSEWSCSDLSKCEYEMVEILEDNNSMTKVLVLAQVDGFKTVFRAQRKRGSAVIVEIPRVELLRFSHQIPAFRLMGERKGTLRGCWELDPESLPVHLFRSS